MKTMLSCSPCFHPAYQRLNMRNTAQVVLPVPLRPTTMSEAGGCGFMLMISSSAGDTCRGAARGRVGEEVQRVNTAH
jgi:hypothetical protein